MKQTSRIVSFFVFPGIVFLVHLFASKILNLYTIFPNLDIPFHYVGGLSIAYTSTQVLSYLEKEKISVSLNKVLFLILTISLTATAAIFWEFAEFIGDRLMDTNIQISLANTMQDQFLGILGGITWAFVYYGKNKIVKDYRRKN
jgi:hypothetical protein